MSAALSTDHPALPARPPVPDGAMDVLVVGGGIVGLTAAWRASRAGLRVTVLDPAPGDGATHAAAGMLAPVTEADFGEEAALRLAATGLGDDVRLVELDEVFTPGGRYRKSMKIGGRRVRVRQSDGVHLNATGAELAARLVLEAIRRDRMLPRSASPG